MKNTKFSVLGRVRVCLEFVKAQNIKDKTIVDVGCSDGWLLNQISGLRPKQMIGMDPSEKAIEKAEKKVKKAKFYVSPANLLPVKSSSADIVTMFDVIEHVPNDGELDALNEINRVLRKKGTLLLSTPHSYWLTNILDPAWYLGHRHYKLEQIKGLLKKAGFKVETAEVRGGIWFSIYLICLYVSKWIFGKKDFKNKFLQDRDDKQFDSSGIHTIFVVAKK